MSRLNINFMYLRQGEGRGVDHYGHVEHHLQREAGRGQEPDTLVEPELEVLVAGGDVDLVVHGEEDVHSGGHHQGVHYGKWVKTS